MADTSVVRVSEEISDCADEASNSIVKKEVSDEIEFALNDEMKEEDKLSSKRKLSISGNSEDDDSKLLKFEGSSVDLADHIVSNDDFNSCNEDEDSNHSDESESSTDDPQVLDDILSIKKMELLQHPQVIAFLQEKMDQTKKKGK